jgi:hypothetical protein
MKKIIHSIILSCTILSANAQTDTLIGVNVRSSKDYKQLTHAICDGCTSDVQKANAIYNWITHHINCDIEKSKDPLRKIEKPEDILKAGKAATDGYADLYVLMCREAGLEAATIIGYAKDWIFDNGDDIYMPRHGWCAVLLNGKWELVDPLSGTGGIDHYDGWLQSMLHNLFSKNKLHYASKEKFVFRYNPDYFMCNPLQFRLKFVPIDPQWQLAASLMPLSVFEAGDTAISLYNTEHPQLKKDNPALLRISGMTEAEKITDYADRAYQYNNNFNAVLGSKEQIQGARILDQPNADKAAATEAMAKYKKALEYYDKQKRSFGPYYSDLTRKNSSKNRDAKDYIRQIRTDNNSVKAAAKRYKLTAERHIDKISDKENKAKNQLNELSPNNLKYVVTNTTQKSASSPELLKLVDSVNNRTARIDDINKIITDKSEQLETAINENKARENRLALQATASDSFMAAEAIYRIELRDNYDDPIKLYSGLYKQTKFGDVDTLHKYYLAAYDTINNLNDQLLKTYSAAMDIYKNNIHDIEQYKKYNSTDHTITDQYEKMVLDYSFVLERYMEILAADRSYEARTIRFLDEVIDLYKREEDVVDKMDEAEDARHAKEDKLLAEKRSFDERENEHRKKELTEHIKELQDYLRNS